MNLPTFSPEINLADLASTTEVKRFFRRGQGGADMTAEQPTKPRNPAPTGAKMEAV